MSAPPSPPEARAGAPQPARPIAVRLGSVLHGYSGGAGEVWARGATLGELLADLELSFPGLRHRLVDEQGRLRPHLAVYLDRRAERSLSASLAGVERVHLLGALSGG
jgi:molybdopterin synthase sulfur carrier subunit